MSYNPAIQILLKEKKNWLIAKANELDLNCTGNKLDLAIRVAKTQEEESDRLWISIMGERRGKSCIK